ncbi:MAG: metallophosphoesterase [Bacillota bacterium]|nr:metallophosphoesterase [Bacillota bacterium]
MNDKLRLAQAEAVGAEARRRSRRKRRRRRLLLLFLVLLLLETQLEMHVTRRETLTLESERLAAGTELRIVQISDYHEFSCGHSRRRILRWVGESGADLVAVTGDVLNRKSRDFAALEALFEGLAETSIPCFYVSGNHDEEHRDGDGNEVGEKLRALLARTGVRVLDNRSVILETGAGPVRLAGTRDAYTDHADLEAALAETAEATASFTLLLTHAPDIIPELERQSGVDLALCGHTHGGQFRLPLVGALFTPGQGWLPHWDRGLFTLANGTRLYIDSGVGWSVLPLRLGTPSQITVVTVQGTG